MRYIEQSIKKYLEDLSAKLPAPGGGSVAALTGALAGGLISMVCNFTIGNPKLPEQEEAKDILFQAAEVGDKLSLLVDEDINVYKKVNAAYKLPKGTGKERTKRSSAIQNALREAEKVPEQILKCSCRLLELSEKLLRTGNPSLITDTGIAALLAYAAMESALLNVEINLGSITDKNYSLKIRSGLKPFMEKGRIIRDAVVSRVEKAVIK